MTRPTYDSKSSPISSLKLFMLTDSFLDKEALVFDVIFENCYPSLGFDPGTFEVLGRVAAFWSSGSLFGVSLLYLCCWSAHAKLDYNFWTGNGFYFVVLSLSLEALPINALLGVSSSSMHSIWALYFLGFNLSLTLTLTWGLEVFFSGLFLKWPPMAGIMLFLLGRTISPKSTSVLSYFILLILDCNGYSYYIYFPYLEFSGF